MERIDLHIHTNCSDGAYSPREIIAIASENNVKAIAIADHDSIESYTDAILEFAKFKEIMLIPAVEMSTRYFGVGIHVLGYNFDLKNKKLNETLSLLKNARVNYLLDVSKKLEALGYVVNTNKLKDLPTVTKAHISLDIVENKENEKLLIKNFGHIPSKGEFIETVMNEGCPAFTEKFSITPIRAAEIIHGAGGKVVLAHPVAYYYEDGVTPEQVDKLVKEMKADGLEANYIYVDRFNKVHDDTEFWNKFAREHNLFTTIGSDFHKEDGLRPELGFVNMNFMISAKEIKNTLNSLK